MILFFNTFAFVGLTIVLALGYTGRGVIQTDTEQGRALLVGLHGMWLAGIVGLLRRIESDYADTAALTAWVAWAVIAWWLVTLHLHRHRD